MYQVEEKHILRDKTLTYFHKFNDFGSWYSEVYKDENKTKTSNL